MLCTVHFHRFHMLSDGDSAKRTPAHAEVESRARGRRELVVPGSCRWMEQNSTLCTSCVVSRNLCVSTIGGFLEVCSFLIVAHLCTDGVRRISSEEWESRAKRGVAKTSQPPAKGMFSPNKPKALAAPAT